MKADRYPRIGSRNRYPGSPSRDSQLGESAYLVMDSRRLSLRRLSIVFDGIRLELPGSRDGGQNGGGGLSAVGTCSSVAVCRRNASIAIAAAAWRGPALTEKSAGPVILQLRLQVAQPV